MRIGNHRYWGDVKCPYTRLEYRSLKVYGKIGAGYPALKNWIFSGFMHSHICAHAKHLCEWRTVWRIIEYTTSWMSDGALLPAVRQSLCVCWPVQQMCACCRLASIEANLVEGRRKAVGHPWGLYLQHVHKWILCSDCRTGTAFQRILSSGKYIWLCAASCQCHWASWEVPEGRLAYRYLKWYIP